MHTPLYARRERSGACPRRPRLFGPLLVLALASTIATFAVLAPCDTAHAQGERSLLIVPFDREQVDPGLYQRFMDQVRSDAESSPDYKPLPPIEQTLTDLLFTVGCAEPEPECMQMIGQEFEADVVLYGSVWSSEQATLQTIQLFDVLAGVSALDAPIERTFETSDQDRLLSMLVSEVQQIFFPFTGVVTITTSEPAAEILFDGAPVGSTLGGPLKLDGRALGEHIITARNDEGYEWNESVVLMHDVPSQLNMELVIPDLGTTFPHLGSYLSFGVGGAALIGGGVFSFLISSANSQGEDLADLDNNPSINANEANNILSSGPTYETVQWVLYGVGAAAVITGAVLYVFFEDDSELPEGEAPPPEGEAFIAPIVTPDGGVGAGALITF